MGEWSSIPLVVRNFYSEEAGASLFGWKLFLKKKVMGIIQFNLYRALLSFIHTYTEMNKFFYLLVVLFTCTAMEAQSLSYKEISAWSKKKKIDFTEYEASNGHVYKVGGFVKLGTPERSNDIFLHVWQQGAISQPEGVGLESARLRSEIIKFKIQGNRRSGYEVVAVGKTPYGLTRFHILLEKGLAAGEVVSEVMSREEAIAKLKEGKDLMDMEMMSAEEFEALKEELTPLIKGE